MSKLVINLRRITANFVSVTAVRGLSGVLSFLLLSYVARQMGVEGVGEFSTLSAFFIFFKQMPLLGLHVPIAREIAAAPEKRATLASDGFTVTILPSIILGLAIGLAGEFMYPANLRLAFWLLGFSIFPTAVTSVCEAILTGEERITQVAFVDLCETVCRTVAVAVSVAAGAGMGIIFSWFLFFRFAAAMIYLWPFKFATTITMRNVTKSGISGLARDIPTFLLILLLAAAINRVGVIVLSQLGTMQEVGYFSPPQKVCEVLLMVMSLATFVCFPVLSRFFERDNDVFRKVVGIALTSFSLLFFPPLAVFAAYSDALLGGLFGAQFASAYKMLEVLALGLGLQALDKVLSASMLAGKQQRQDLIILTTVFVLFAGLLVGLVPVFGGLGLAYGITISAFVQFLLRLLFASRMLGTKYLLATVTRLIFAGVVMFFILVQLKGLGWPFLAVIASGLAVFLGLTVITGGIPWRDIMTTARAMKIFPKREG